MRTDASRRFADLLDAVEHAVRATSSFAAAMPVARLEPCLRRTGREATLAILRRHKATPDGGVTSTNSERWSSCKRDDGVTASRHDRLGRRRAIGRRARDAHRRRRRCGNRGDHGRRTLGWRSACNRGRRDARAAFLKDVLATVPVLVYDVAVAEAHAAVARGGTTGRQAVRSHDLIIAGTALATGRTVVTADGSAFTDLARRRRSVDSRSLMGDTHECDAARPCSPGPVYVSYTLRA